MGSTVPALRMEPYAPAARNRSAATAGQGTRERIQALDIVRGVVMILMAIDHVRVYSGVPAGGPTPVVFFTRWVTHFVAPAFVFLAGTGAYLLGQKLGSRAALSRFLVTRGLWLVLLEFTVLRVAWTFNLDFRHYMLAGVIWMLGWCMVLLAGLLHLGVAANAVAGVLIITLHNLTDYFPSLAGTLPARAAWLWKILYFGTGQAVGERVPLIILFVIVLWIAVMMCGYAFGVVMRMPSDTRRKICLWLGLALTIGFVGLRAVNGYGDPRHWKAGSVLSFLATTKYPASLLFLMMTLGPMFLGLVAADRARGWAAGALATFGRVPLFYYLLHIPAIHAAACAVSLIRTGAVNPWLLGNHPMAPGPVPAGYTWSLPLLYLVFAVVVMGLYVPCRWYGRVKAANRSVWLSYL